MAKIGERLWFRVLACTYSEAQDDGISVVSAGVAFWVALAMFPSVALLVWVASRLAGPEEARWLVHVVSEAVPAIGRSIVEEAAQSSLRHNPADGATEAAWLGRAAPLAGVAFTFWSASSGMKALFDAMNIVYDKKERRSFWCYYALTLAATSCTLLLLFVTALLVAVSPAVLTRVGVDPDSAVRLLRWPVLLVVLGPGLALLNRYAPNREREHWPLVTVGSILASVAIVLDTALFSLVMAHVSNLAVTYGSLGAVAALLLWLWTAFLIVLTCAELDSEIERLTSLYGTPTVGSGKSTASAERV